MAYTTLAKINNYYAAQNINIVDGMLRNATIMQNMYFKPASHGNVDKYQSLSTSPTVSQVNSAFGLTSTAISGDLVSLNLAIMQSLASEPSVLVRQTPSKNGLTPYETYFMDRQPIYLKKIAKTFEDKLLYGTTNTTQFNGLLAQATADGTTSSKGGAAGSSTDIFFWRQEEDNSHGLFNESLVSEGNLINFDWTPAKGQTQLITQTTAGLTTNVECYSGIYTSALGLKIISSGYVAAITGITAAKKPTQTDVDQALLSINAHLSPAETMIICSPKGYGYLKDALGGQLTRIVNDGTNNVSNTIEVYNGAKIVINSNVKDTR